MLNGFFFPTLYAANERKQNVFSSLLCHAPSLSLSFSVFRFLFLTFSPSSSVAHCSTLLVSDSEAWCACCTSFYNVCHCHDILVYLHGDVSTFFGIVSTCAIVLRCMPHTSFFLFLSFSPSKPCLAHSLVYYLYSSTTSYWLTLLFFIYLSLHRPHWHSLFAL